MTIQQGSSQHGFDDFFSIDHTFSVNIKPLNQQPSFEAFIASIPMPFQMVNDVSSIDQAALRPLQTMNSIATQLVDYLHHQDRKINLLVGYVLSQQDDVNYRYPGVKFGGGGFIFSHDKSFNCEDKVEVKIFFHDENSGVYAIGEIIEINEKGGLFYHKVIFTLIREDDRELLVKASLQQQSKQLQQRALARQKT